MTTITDYELYRVPPRWLFLRLTTSDGLEGWGEPIVEGKAKTVAAAVEEMLDTYLVGESPEPIADHWERLYRGGFYRGGPVLMSAIAGIDQALWDIKGKQLGTPVHTLFGGPVRTRVRVYQWIGGDRPAAVAEQAEERLADGLTALKMNATPEFRPVESPASVADAADRLGAVRDRVGPEVDIGVDFHGRVAKPMVKRLAAALEPHEPMFIEEPLLPEHSGLLSSLASHTSIPIATGERLFHRTDFAPLLANGSVDIIQPDLSHAGGITEVQRIAAMADAHDISLAPHCPLGPIAFASSIQIDACAPNALIQEQSLNIHYNQGNDLLDYLADPQAFAYEDGYVKVPDEPGLGVSLDLEYVREKADTAEDWHNPIWRHEDGSVAEW